MVARERLRARITGVESALPERRVTNAELAAAHPDWDMEKIAERSGVSERRICAPDETALDLGERAAAALLERLEVSRDTVGAVLFCTQSPDHIMPPNACLLHDRLGLPGSVPALDFTLACSGYVYGLFLARSLIESGASDRVLLVTADTYSRFLHPEDRSTVTLFGDGGAATLVCADDAADRGIGSFSLGTDGGNADIFWIEAGGARVPASEETARPVVDLGGSVSSPDCITMDGPRVLAFVRKRVPDMVNDVLAKAQLTLADVDLVIFHQGSALALDYAERWLSVPKDKTFRNLATVGNTVSASIPIALRDAENAGRLRPGMRVLLVGFGVGLSWGACLVDW
jgi:3-oxoacyl-[acyl-carrier-protein] synthase-3